MRGSLLAYAGVACKCLVVFARIDDESLASVKLAAALDDDAKAFLNDHQPSALHPVVSIIFYALLALEFLFLLGFWQLVRSGAIDQLLSRMTVFSQLTVGLFDDGEVVVNSEENSGMEQLPSIKVNPKDRTLHTCDDSEEERERMRVDRTQIINIDPKDTKLKSTYGAVAGEQSNAESSSAATETTTQRSKTT